MVVTMYCMDVSYYMVGKFCEVIVFVDYVGLLTHENYCILAIQLSDYNR